MGQRAHKLVHDTTGHSGIAVLCCLATQGLSDIISGWSPPQCIKEGPESHLQRRGTGQPPTQWDGGEDHCIKRDTPLPLPQVMELCDDPFDIVAPVLGYAELVPLFFSGVGGEGVGRGRGGELQEVVHGLGEHAHHV